MAARAKDRNEIVVGKTRLIVEPGKQEVIVTRLFDFPRERVFKAMTDPKLIPDWWGGPGESKTTVDKLDPRPGGSWRFVEESPSGEQHAFHGVMHEVAAPERLVYTFEYEGQPGHVALETITLEELEGKTMVQEQMVFQSVEDRDGMVQSGMQDGANASLDRLEALLLRG